MRSSQKKWLTLALLIVLGLAPLSVLSACGRQGDLYLPSQTD